MTGSKTKILSLIILTCLNCRLVHIFGSDIRPENQDQKEIDDIYNEKYYLMTDRTIYAVGEKIIFKVFNNSPGSIKSAYWSRVLYVELTKSDGSTVQQGKYPLDLSGVKGYMVIPGNIYSGYYYLRAYTKWMRNFPVTMFAYCRVKIINPFSSKVEQGKNAENDAVSFQESFINQTMHESIIHCQTDRKKYTNHPKTSSTPY